MHRRNLLLQIVLGQNLLVSVNLLVPENALAVVYISVVVDGLAAVLGPVGVVAFSFGLVSQRSVVRIPVPPYFLFM